MWSVVQLSPFCVDLCPSIHLRIPWWSHPIAAPTWGFDAQGLTGQQLQLAAARQRPDRTTRADQAVASAGWEFASRRRSLVSARELFRLVDDVVEHALAFAPGKRLTLDLACANHFCALIAAVNNIEGHGSRA